MSQQQDLLLGSKGEASKIDYKRIVYHAWRYWYWILLSLIISLSIAYLINRYSTRVYPIQASLLIREKEELNGADILYNNPLFEFHKFSKNRKYLLVDHV